MVFVEKYDLHSGKNHSDKEIRELLRKIEEHTDPNIFRHLESENYQKEMQKQMGNVNKQIEQSEKLRELFSNNILTSEEYSELAWSKQIKLSTIS